MLAQLGAISIAIFVGIKTIRMFRTVSSWIAPDGRVHVAGYVYLLCIILLYAVIIFYVTRVILISLFLRKLAACAPLQILPLHPDGCGGLRPVGWLGLRNQYTLTVLGINLVVLVVVWVYFMGGTINARSVWAIVTSWFKCGSDLADVYGESDSTVKLTDSRLLPAKLVL